MRLACCQFGITWEDKPANYRRADELIAQAGLASGTFVLLPEMFATGFTMNASAMAEPADGPTAQFLADLARRHQVSVMGGLVIGDESGKLRNEALVFGPDGSQVARYAKMHLFSYAREPRYYVPGDRPVMCTVGDALVGPAICYDLRFPELFRLLVSQGAEVLALVACWPAARHEHWLALLKARAIENQCYVAAVNRVGSDPSGLSYSGGSQIIDPRGQILADAGQAECVIQAEISLEFVRRYRHEFPSLSDMRLIGQGHGS